MKKEEAKNQLPLLEDMAEVLEESLSLMQEMMNAMEEEEQSKTL